MKRILTIIGARPQFIKASVVSKAIQDTSNASEIILHTGQHFDLDMSDVFFKQLGIPHPDIQLNINGGGHGQMTGRMLAEIEQHILTKQPDMVLVYGDTNSTLAGALAAAKLHIPIAHIEAGLRSYNMQMPEEVNRILTDQISNLLFCPTETAVQNLYKEGFSKKPVTVLNAGDVMQDAAILFGNKAIQPQELSTQDNFILATLHRAENTENPLRLKSIIGALNHLHNEFTRVVLPLHPRTRKIIQRLGIRIDVEIINPVGYLEIIWLLKNTGLVLTDSGGMQKEAFFFGKACVTMRDQTEWIELVENGYNTLAGADRDKIIDAVQKNVNRRIHDNKKLYGGGKASQYIVKHMIKY